MYYKILLSIFLLLYSSSVFAGEDIVKASIVKLIDENAKLKKRVALLEEKIDSLSHIKKKDLFLKINPVYFFPKKASYIRKMPTSSSDRVMWAVFPQKYKITAIKCIDKVGFWGKSTKGWIYISNPDYGKITTLEMLPLSQDYKKWCK